VRSRSRRRPSIGAARLAGLAPALCRAAGSHLIADAREADLVAGKHDHWRRRLLGAMRERLLAEEVAA
jgi:hypothetical protein